MEAGLSGGGTISYLFGAKNHNLSLADQFTTSHSITVVALFFEGRVGLQSTCTSVNCSIFKLHLTITLQVSGEFIAHPKRSSDPCTCYSLNQKHGIWTL